MFLLKLKKDTIVSKSKILREKMKKIILDGRAVDIYSEEFEYVKRILKGIYENKYAEIGFIAEGKEVEDPEYTRKLAKFEIVSIPAYEKILITNKKEIRFNEASENWGKLDYIILSCNGGTLWSPCNDIVRRVSASATIIFQEHNLCVDFDRYWLKFI